MDTKRLHSNHPKKVKSSTDSGKHEVFVLPPDLLKKLGICIGNINESQGNLMDANASSIAVNNGHIGNIVESDCGQEPSDTSILETADLMKKSVFLSPTFVSTIASVIPGEIEILSKSDTDVSIAVTDLQVAENVFKPLDNIEITNQLPEAKDTQRSSQKVNQTKLSYNTIANGEYTSSSDSQEYQHISRNENEIQLSNIVNKNQENLDTVESSLNTILEDAHTPRIERNTTFTINSKETDSTRISDNLDIDNSVQNVSKINIISEETIPLSKLRALKRSRQSSNIKNLTPLTVNSIIDTKVNNEKSNSHRANTNEKNPMESPKITKKLNSKVVKSNLKSMIKNKYMETKPVPSVISSLEGEATIRDKTVTASNKIDHVDKSEIEQCLENTSHLISMDHTKKEDEKVNEHLNETNNNTNKTIADCQLNESNRVPEDYMAEKFATVNGFDILHDMDVSRDKNTKSYKYCNGQTDEIMEPISNNENDRFEETEHLLYNKAVNSSVKIKETDIEKNDVETVEVTKKICNDDNSSKNMEDRTLPNDELAKILNASKEQSTSNRNMNKDKVKEIAAYLKKFSHIYTDKEKVKMSHDNHKKETINSNTNIITSKSCIQGVEKPGGKEMHTDECKVLKTYTTRNPPNKPKLLTGNHQSHLAGDASHNELDTVNISTCEIQKFCLCCDFGRLAYYDDHESLYEHIHFWKKNSANCELNLIFAMYSDETMINSGESGLEQEQKTEEEIEANNVCWNFLRNEHENIDYSDLEQNWNSNCINEVKDPDFDDCFQISNLDAKAREGNNSILTESDQAHIMTNNSNHHIIVEAVSHNIINTNESKNSNTVEYVQNIQKTLNDKNDDSVASAVVTTTDITNESTNLNTLESKSTVRIDNSDDIDGNLSNAKEHSNKKLQHNESISNLEKTPREEVKLNLPKTVTKVAPKRKLSGEKTPAPVKNSNDEPSSKKNIKCGLCNTLFSEKEWNDHVTNQHDLIAWRAGSSINLDSLDLFSKLKKRLKSQGKLKCSMCNMETKRLSKFIEHSRTCIQQKFPDTRKKADKPKRKSRAVDENVTCGVCQQSVEPSSWFQHIGRNHDYLAWAYDQDAVNLEDDQMVRQHLMSIIRSHGNLVCYKCGFNRARVKLYLEHIKTCDGNGKWEGSSTSANMNSTALEDETVEQAPEATIIKCGVCKLDVTKLEWIKHIAKEHNYMAWQDGETPLNLEEEEEVWNHLQKFIREHGGLICHKCGLKRRRVKLYLTHVETCDGTQCDISFNNVSLDTTTNSTTDQWFEVAITTPEEKKIVKCGVCSQEVPIVDWIQHIGKEHHYLAWQDGTTLLNLDDESETRSHLLEISRHMGGLICSKCEKKIKYPKTFLLHLKECTGLNISLDDSTLDNSTSSCNVSLTNKKIKKEGVICGVCAKQLESTEWMEHLHKVHQYLAWIEGQPPIDFDDAAMLLRHLTDISKVLGGLVCVKCGVRRKYVKSYQHHLEACQGKPCSTELSLSMMNKDILECAVCSEKVAPKDWREHAMKKHYNIAWVVGNEPIELNNPYAVESYLKEYQYCNNKLVCKVCGISRVSYVGFYAHIIVCGKTEEETEMYKSVCDICNNKYLRIYKSQHMTMHREKELALERKILAAKERELKKEEPIDVIIPTGRRKAAEKAKTVIEKYKNTLHDGNYHCSKCGFSSEIEKELSDHVCVEDKWADASDSDESVKLDNCSDDESDDTEVDSNVSDEEREEREEREQASNKKKRYSDTTSSASKISRIPYPIHNISSYMKKSAEEFIEMYLTEEKLFTQWQGCEYEEVPENELSKFMPPIEESCKVRFDVNEDWVAFNRFQSDRKKDTLIFFVGSSIQCMSWVPSPSESNVSTRPTQFVSIAVHCADDAPRLAWDATPKTHSLIQIWDCDNLMTNMPKFALGIIHDYGTVWAMDWCPSGARDDPDFESEPNKMYRLGLLATVCSNGSAYIFSVPYPASITEKDKPFYRLKPVAELRLTSNKNRKTFQATAVKWSAQKGHSQIVVGYGDGTMAFYDLNGESPLLRTTENNITVFYPYHDERVQNSCIEDVDIYPSELRASTRADGPVCAGGPGGAGAGVLQSHVAAARVLYPPHWPAALLAGDDCLVKASVNELEWWGGGRRLGGMRSAAGCMWCGRFAAAAPPLIRLQRLHPAYPDLHKLVIGLIQMTPLGNKRKRQNDELAMIVEPITYSEVVKKYGLEFKQIKTRDRNAQVKLSQTPGDAYPERFPLSDVAAMQFCPAFRHHNKLAIALHSGLVFIISV